MHEEFEMTVGLEVHAELKTESKIFCSCRSAYGAPPNTHVCPICLGMPGTLPVLNRRAVELAVRAGLVCGCEIHRLSRFDRKNYFYPDLPKGYQITQYAYPLCTGGGIWIEAEGTRRRIGIERIHLEEDAGKLLHAADATRADYNRAGVPLIEIVSAPELHSSTEAKAYLSALRELLLFAEVSDCRMNEGSMRCDVNLSVRRRGSEALGTRTEIKNINSVAFAGRAIEYEFARQAQLLAAGGAVTPQTRRFDEGSGSTVLMREKESAKDYRYLPEPDLLPLQLEEADIDAIRASLPLPAEQWRGTFRGKYGVSAQDAHQITETPRRAVYFDAAARETAYPAAAANLCIGEIFPSGGEATETPPAAILARIATLAGEKKISAASARRLVHMCADGRDPAQCAEDGGMLLLTDPGKLEELAREAIRECPEAAAQFLAGKQKAKQAILGALMRKSRGSADAAAASGAIDRLLNSDVYRKETEQ